MLGWIDWIEFEPDDGTKLLIQSDDTTDDDGIDVLIKLEWYNELLPLLIELLVLLLELLLLFDKPKSCWIAKGDRWGTWLFDELPIRVWWLWWWWWWSKWIGLDDIGETQVCNELTLIFDITSPRWCRFEELFKTMFISVELDELNW